MHLVSGPSQHPDEPFAALAHFKEIIEKARKQAHQELLRNTPDSLGAKLLIAATALRAHRNRHPGTFMRCCAAWEPVGKSLDKCSFECVDFHGLIRNDASLTRERIAEREAAAHNLPWTQTEKDNALPTADSAWSSEKPLLYLHAVTDEDGHPLEDEDELGMRLCNCCGRVFVSRTEDERHLAHETILESS